MHYNEVLLNSPPLEGCPQGGVVVFRVFLAGYLNTSPSWLPEHPQPPLSQRGGAVMHYNEVLLNFPAGGGAVMYYNEVLLNFPAGGGAVMYYNEVLLNSPPLEGCPQGGVVV